MRFQKQIVQSLVWRGIYFVSVLIMNIFLSRYFEAGNAGWIFYLSNNFSLLLIVVGLTIENSVNYYGAKKEIGQNRLAWFSLVWTAMVALVITAIVWLYLNWGNSATAINNTQYLFYTACYVIGIQLTSFFTVLFYIKKNFFLPNFLMLLLNVGFILYIPKQEGAGSTNPTLMINVYFGYFAAIGFTLVTAFILKHKSWKNFGLPEKAHMKLLIRYAVVALAANIIFFLVYRVDYWFVQKFCSAVELGNYIQVSKLVQMLLIVPTIISGVVFPHTASGVDTSTVKNNILRIGRITSLIYVFALIVILLAGRQVFPFVFGNSYSLMYMPFLLLLPGVWALSNLYILSAYFGGVNKVSVNVKGAAVALLVILAGDIVFIPLYGIAAAATVSSAGYLINFLYSFLNMKKEHTVSLKEYWAINKSDIQWLKSILYP